MAEDAKAKNTVIEQAKARLKKCQEAEQTGRNLSREDFRFYKGEQWPEDIKRLRSRQGGLAVCMTVNLCKPAVKQITNDQRQNRGAIKVSPVDSGADPETAQVLQGVIRHIEYDSNADITYDTASDHQVIGGFGWMRVLTEYEDPRSFYQCIKITRFRNPFTVYLDPSSTEPDGSDAKFGFVLSKLSKKEYEDEYPDSEMASLCEAEDANLQFPDWVDDGGVVVAEYYYIEAKKDTLYQLKDGSVKLGSELGGDPAEEEIFDKREVEIERVKWCKLNGAEILEETDWPGKYIPLVKVIGDELEVDGELVLEGLIRQAQDPQRMVNYWESKQTEAIALAPKAPYVAAEGQIEGHEKEWQRANIDNVSVLTYKPVDLSGHPVPPPQRQVAEPAIAAITVAGQSARENFKSVTQLFEASYGQRSNEKSGRAILARQQQGQTGNFHFVDNLSRSRRHLGRILIDLIPKIYREKGRILRIIGEDGTQNSITVGQKSKFGGVERIFDLSTGRYDVIVETGPSFATKRREAVESMMEVISALPNVFSIMGDLLIKNMDWPGAQEMADRAKFLLPPELRQDDKQQPLPPAVTQKMQQSAQMIDLLTKELNAKNDLIENKQMELDSKERIEMAKIQAQMLETQLKLDSQEAIAALKAEVDSIKAGMQLDAQAAARAQKASETIESAHA